ncbi:MAG: ATP-binding cassette domain-containing protein [Chloroflexota bacterium]
MTTAVLARGLIAVYPDPAGPVAALRGLDLGVDLGELAAVVGPSGSGKTTLLRLLAGLERPTAGSLDVLGLALASASDRALRQYRRETVAIVEQHYRATLSPYQSIRRSVALPLAVRGVPAGERDRRVDELLERVGLGGRGASLPAELSGGEQQRVAVAAALVTRPRLLLADEPTGELDARTAEDLLSLLRELVRETGTTAVVVTHDEAVERIADRTVHLRDGRAVAQRRGTSLTALDDALGWRAPPLGMDPTAEPGTGPSDASRPSGPAAAIGAAVRLDGVSRIYGGSATAVRAIEDVSFILAEGGFHVLSGPSGAGKSTLLRLIAGLDDPTAGSIETLGTPMQTLDREGRARFRAERLGIVDQGRGLTPFLTSIENVALLLAIHGQDRATAGKRALAALEKVGLAALADRRPASLSAGERTRVSIARALASEPELILLDEPTATLDRASADRMGELLAGLAGTRTIVAATHDRALMDRATDGYVLD